MRIVDTKFGPDGQMDVTIQIDNCSECPHGNKHYMDDCVKCDYPTRAHEIHLIGNGYGVPKDCPIRGLLGR